MAERNYGFRPRLEWKIAVTRKAARSKPPKQEIGSLTDIRKD